MPRSIFVSCADRDRVLVDHALQYLRQLSILSPEDQVAIARDIFTADTDPRKATQDAIGSADSVLVIWTPAAAASGWVYYELGMADALGKDVIAIVTQGHAAAFPPSLRTMRVFEMPAPEAGSYELKKDTGGQYSFILKAPNSSVLLQSEPYESKNSALNGIASVQSNSFLESRYVVKPTNDGRFYFHLKAANGQVIGTSQLYNSAAACNAGIQSVKATGSIAELRENTKLS